MIGAADAPPTPAGRRNMEMQWSLRRLALVGLTLIGLVMAAGAGHQWN